MKVKTPFRWPGAKNKLLPTIEEHLINLGFNNHSKFIDVFVGGGSVLLTIAQKYPRIELHCNDLNKGISSFWSILSEKNPLKMFELLKLMKVQPTIKQFYKLAETPPTSDIEHAYQAIYFNRCCFSGIIKNKSPIGGKDQKSKYKVDCRYNFKKLQDKILYCHELLKGRTIVENIDFSNYSMLTNSNDMAYIDPPYVNKGGSLYTENMSKEQHASLANILIKRQNWLLSYDDNDYIRNLYSTQKITNLAAKYCINGEKKSWEHKNELLISSIKL